MKKYSVPLSEVAKEALEEIQLRDTVIEGIKRILYQTTQASNIVKQAQAYIELYGQKAKANKFLNIKE